MANESLLESWNETPTKAAITGFVRAATERGPGFVPVEERIATFDNDGTLWTEKPMPIELMFVLRRWVEMADADPSLRDRQPWKAAVERDFAWLGGVVDRHYAGDDTDMRTVVGSVFAAYAGLDVEEYARQAAEFIRGGSHPSLGRPFTGVGFQPMVELLRYLEANGFTTLIASGGSRDFMRSFALDVYGLAPERIIGSANQLAYSSDGGGSLVYQAAPDAFDDGPAKPVRIWNRLGRRPLVAGGNSNGDIPMLEFAGTADRPALRLLVLHDDAEREADYTKGAEQALDRARADGWTIISVKDDWSTVFAG
ncbi:MAG: HAD family hydrolase [Chloroflexota bacterium]